MPAIFTGFRIAAGLSVIGAIVGDSSSGGQQAGIGIVIDSYRSAGAATRRCTAALILAALLGIVVFVFFGWLGNLVVGRWHESDPRDRLTTDPHPPETARSHPDQREQPQQGETHATTDAARRCSPSRSSAALVARRLRQRRDDSPTRREPPRPSTAATDAAGDHRQHRGDRRRGGSRRHSPASAPTTVVIQTDWNPRPSTASCTR